MLSLVSRWPSWVHRRVESISLEDPETIRRRVSVDFTLFSDLPPLITTGDGDPLFFVPLTLLRKQPLVDFDLRDEEGRALPLLTREWNGSLAAATLGVLSEGIASPAITEAYGSKLPSVVEKDLWAIATAPPEEARAVCRSLGSRDEYLLTLRIAWAGLLGQSTDARAVRGWRQELAGNDDFMSLARSLTDNF
jgi:hypothetical protein